MRATTYPQIDPGFITLCIKMAQTTLSEVMPADADSTPTPTVRAESKPGLLTRLDNWFYRQQVSAREAYLAESTDIFDLESRMRHLERREYSYC